MCSKEVEAEVLRACRVLQHGVDGSHGAPEVVGVKGHSNIYAVHLPGAAFVAISEGWSLPKQREIRRGEAEDAAEANGLDNRKVAMVVEDEDKKGQEA